MIDVKTELGEKFVFADINGMGELAVIDEPKFNTDLYQVVRGAIPKAQLEHMDIEFELIKINKLIRSINCKNI